MPAATTATDEHTSTGSVLDRALVEHLPDADLLDLLLQRFRRFISTGHDPYRALMLAVGRATSEN